MIIKCMHCDVHILTSRLTRRMFALNMLNFNTVVPLLKDTLWRGHPSIKDTNSWQQLL